MELVTSPAGITLAVMVHFRLFRVVGWIESKHYEVIVPGYDVGDDQLAEEQAESSSAHRRQVQQAPSPVQEHRLEPTQVGVRTQQGI